MNAFAQAAFVERERAAWARRNWPPKVRHEPIEAKPRQIFADPALIARAIPDYLRAFSRVVPEEHLRGDAVACVCGALTAVPEGPAVSCGCDRVFLRMASGVRVARVATDEEMAA